MNALLLRKTVVAVSGLFLCAFLVVHLSVNLILLLPEEVAREYYNACSTKLRESAATKVVAYVLYLAILAHAVYGLRITIVNRRAKPTAYVVNRAGENSTWRSRNMGALGALILIFLVIHLIQFWARIKLGFGDPPALDAHGHRDVYSVAQGLFENVWIVLLYAAVSIPLAQHLHHGVASGFRTLGLYDHRLLGHLATVSALYAWGIGLGFAVVPIVMFVR